MMLSSTNTPSKMLAIHAIKQMKILPTRTASYCLCKKGLLEKMTNNLKSGIEIKTSNLPIYRSYMSLSNETCWKPRGFTSTNNWNTSFSRTLRGKSAASSSENGNDDNNNNDDDGSKGDDSDKLAEPPIGKNCLFDLVLAYMPASHSDLLCILYYADSSIISQFTYTIEGG